MSGLFGTVAVLSVGCVGDSADDTEIGSQELEIGEVEGDTGSWDFAKTCKQIPDVAPLADPEITISIDGLTLHLRDRAGTYDRVFPIGPGALKSNGTSLTPTGSFHTGADTTEVKDGKWGYYYACRIWYTSKETGSTTPSFAGLPFIRFEGTKTSGSSLSAGSGYAIHGPIDYYTAPNGGSLKHGYVSHGCVRMEAADIVELYARIRGIPNVPVNIQQGVEIREDGVPIDVDSEDRWVGSVCESDADCPFEGGRCRFAPAEIYGMCTVTCEKYCDDIWGEVPTFCISDEQSGFGMCVPQASSTFNRSCARYDDRLEFAKGQKRPDGSGNANVCSP